MPGFQFLIVFKHVYLFQAVVVGFYVIFVTALAHVGNAAVIAVDIYDGRGVGLPVKIWCVASDHCLRQLVVNAFERECVSAVAQYK